MKQRINAWSAVLRRNYGGRVQKIALDTGAGCPHRVGLSSGGCVFCDALGGGSGASLKGISLEDQIDNGFCSIRRRYKTDKAILYFQSYSATNVPLENLVQTVGSAIASAETRGNVVGISLGARPDQISEPFLDYLESLSAKGLETWLELGVQTTDPCGLEWLRRGHGVECVYETLRLSTERKLFLCAHLIAGIPGERPGQLARSAATLSKLGVHALKFHPLYVLRETELETRYRNGSFSPLALEEYAAQVVEALRVISPETIIQRLTADASFPRLVAPRWITEKASALAEISRLMEDMDAFQGDRQVQ